MYNFICNVYNYKLIQNCITRYYMINPSWVSSTHIYRENPAKNGEVSEWRQALWHHRVQWVPADDEQARWWWDQHGCSHWGI